MDRLALAHLGLVTGKCTDYLRITQQFESKCYFENSCETEVLFYSSSDICGINMNNIV